MIEGLREELTFSHCCNLSGDVMPKLVFHISEACTVLSDEYLLLLVYL